MKKLIALLFAFSIGLPVGKQAFGDEFTIRAAQIAEYRKWLETLGSSGSRYWVRLDSERRPHKLYLGEGFYRADLQSQEHFVDTFSHYLAGHPEKFMLIDLYDEATKMPVGEFGWGGFRMYPTAVVSSAEIQK
ncbi:MAG TPA: hypothetical protein VGL11_11075 [Candidatus Binatia bacterium]|jgi:hypothetical protein